MKKQVLSLSILFAAVQLNAQTWTAAQTTGTTENLRGVSMASPTTGWACGFNSTIVKTTDGGANWSGPANPGGLNLFSVGFTSTTTGLVVGDNGISPGGPVNCAVIKRTTDGGSTWTDITAPDTGNYWLRSVAFADATTAVAVGTGGTIIRTTDAGATWISIASPVTNNLWDVDFPTAATGYAVQSYYTGTAYSTSVIKTTDGGLTWAVQGSPVTGLCYSLSFINNTDGWMSVSNSVYATTDGGATWTQTCANTGIQINTTLFNSATDGWIGGNYMVADHSVDGGVTWSMTTSGSGGSVNSIDFVNATTGIAVGDAGTILRYTPSAVGIAYMPSTQNKLNLFPNPSNDAVSVELNSTFAGTIQMQVSDLTGRILLSQSFSGNKFQPDISQLPGGAYFLTVSEGEIKHTVKFIKQ